MVMGIILSIVLLFVGVAVLVVVHMCVVARVFWTGHETVQAPIPGSFRITGSYRHGIKRISNEDLKNLPCFDYQAAEKEGTNPSECVVCLENFKVGDKCRSLPNCNHTFHTECIDSWLVKTPICPICRKLVNPSKVGVVFRQENNSISIDVGVELT